MMKIVVETNKFKWAEAFEILRYYVPELAVKYEAEMKEMFETGCKAHVYRDGREIRIKHPEYKTVVVDKVEYVGFVFVFKY